MRAPLIVNLRAYFRFMPWLFVVHVLLSALLAVPVGLWLAQNFTILFMLMFPQSFGQAWVQVGPYAWVVGSALSTVGIFLFGYAIVRIVNKVTNKLGGPMFRPSWNDDHLGGEP